mgnify:CR=1 FL=1
MAYLQIQIMCGILLFLKNEKCSIAVPARLQRQVLQQKILIILYFLKKFENKCVKRF